MSGMTASGSGGLSLRERLRLEAQQRLASQERAPPANGNGATLASTSSDSDEDGVPLPALTLGGRIKRQAAVNAPKSYQIDPMDSATALGYHPHARPTLAIPTGSRQASDDVLRLLREKSRRSARGTDQDGFSRAEAIANSMERARLQKMGIASDLDSPSGSVLNDVGSSKTSNLTVRALSPTIPSYMWSSESEADDDAVDTSSVLSSDSETNADADSRIAASLLATAADSKDAQATVDILRKDTLQQQNDRLAKSDDDHGRIPFWCEGRTSRPSVYDFCRAPEPGLGDAVQDSLIDVGSEWDETAVHILLAGAIPPSLNLGAEHIERLIIWTAWSYVLADDTETGSLSLALFNHLVKDQTRSVDRAAILRATEPALAQILDKVPVVLARIGVRRDVLETCFPSHVKHLPASFPVVHRNGAKRKRKHSSRRYKLHLTLTERDEILINMCRMVRAVAPHTSEDKYLGMHGGIASSLTLAAASSTNLELQIEAGRCVQDIFELSSCKTSDGVLQSGLRSALKLVRPKRLPSQARFVAALNGDGVQLQAFRRWTAWSFLVESDGSEQDASYVQPWSLDLTRLESAVNGADLASPFYISPMGGGTDVRQTDYQGLIAATQLLAATLQDLPVHMCTFDPPDPSIRAETVPEASKATPSRRATALMLAMTSYKALRPSLDPARVATLQRITAALAAVGNKIRDNRGDIVLRTLAKDLIQRTVHALEYQLALFDPASAKRSFDTA